MYYKINYRKIPSDDNYILTMESHWLKLNVKDIRYMLSFQCNIICTGACRAGAANARPAPLFPLILMANQVTDDMPVLHNVVPHCARDDNPVANG